MLYQDTTINYDICCCSKVRLPRCVFTAREAQNSSVETDSLSGQIWRHGVHELTNVFVGLILLWPHGRRSVCDHRSHPLFFISSNDTLFAHISLMLLANLLVSSRTLRFQNLEFFVYLYASGEGPDPPSDDRGLRPAKLGRGGR